MDDRDIGLAQTSRRARKSIENLLKIKRRSADHPEHIGGRGLLLKRFMQVVGALL
jgi:hypothetical protein